MNTQPRDPQGAASLPGLSPQRIDEIEDALFADIAADRARATAQRRRRGRYWIAGGAAAAVIVVAAVIAPSIGTIVSPTGGSDSSAIAPAEPDTGAADSTAESSAGSRDSAPLAGDLDAAGGSADAAVQPAGRDIVTTASATVTVEDVDAAARTVADTAAAHGGYVESMSIGSDGTVYPVDPAQTDSSGMISPDVMPYPAPTDGAWITVRVPADQLTDVLGSLDDLGSVTATNVGRQDVTSQTVDLQARIDAAQASVDRLTTLMGQAQSVSDLIAAESALSERQALLESYQQQLKMLDDQVAMSTLSVTLTPEVEPVTADPAGFGDGLAAGWNGLVATLNGIVVAIGFLIPWLAVAAVAGFIVWLIVRAVRRRRSARTAPPAEAAASVDEPKTE